MPYKFKNGTIMSFFSILGRLLLSYIFILSAWEMYAEFSDDGGSFAHEIAPNVASFQIFLTSRIGYSVPEINVKYVTLATIVVKAVGAVLFVFGRSIGAYMMIYYLLIVTPLFYDFFNYNTDDAEFHALLLEFSKCYSIAGALIFFIGMKNELIVKKKLLNTKTT